MFPFFWDPSMIIVIPGILFAIFAQTKVQGAYSKYVRKYVTTGMTGFQVAQMILNKNRMNVDIYPIEGSMSDHYNPINKTLNLSREVYFGTSIAAYAIAAHEVGHAIQDEKNYSFLRIRHHIAPVANITSNFSIILIMVGLFIPKLIFFADLGILFFSIAVLFQIITLPVEFDASKRALVQLQELNIMNTSELQGSKKVLDAAALTYVAAMAVAVLQLVRLILIRNQED